MSTYGQFCPVAQALEILGERWTLLIVRELLMGSSRFNEIRRGVPKISRTVLAERLRTLTDANVVERVETDQGPAYRLTEAGAELRPIVERIGVWGKQNLKRALSAEELDAGLLMWDLQRRIERSRLPDGRTMVLFRFADGDVGQRRFWLRLERDDVDLCLTNPGYDVDLTVDTDVRTLTEVWTGTRALRQAIRARDIELSGPAPLKRAFPDWLMLSVFAEA